MKKLIIVATAIVAGVVAHASSVAWTCTNVKDINGANLKSGSAYVFFVAGDSKADTSSWAALDGKGADALSAALAGANYSYKKSDLTNAGDGVFSYNAASAGAALPLGDVGLTGSTKYSVYAVILDTDTVTDDSHFYVTAATAASTTFADAASTTKSYMLTATSSATASNWYAAAPEPTSGLLLLLGMAGLALRRKRA